MTISLINVPSASYRIPLDGMPEFRLTLSGPTSFLHVYVRGPGESLASDLAFEEDRFDYPGHEFTRESAVSYVFQCPKLKAPGLYTVETWTQRGCEDIAKFRAYPAVNSRLATDIANEVTPVPAPASRVGHANLAALVAFGGCLPGQTEYVETTTDYPNGVSYTAITSGSYPADGEYRVAGNGVMWQRNTPGAVSPTDPVILGAIQKHGDFATTTPLALTSNASTSLLPVTITGLAANATYAFTVDCYVRFWLTANPTVTRTLWLKADVSAVTNGSGVPTCTVQGNPTPISPAGVSALGLVGVDVLPSTGGFTVYATRQPGVACTASCKGWHDNYEVVG